MNHFDKFREYVITEFLGPESRKHFDTTLRLLDSMGVAYDVVPRLVRGLDYYTRTVFETTLPGLGAQDVALGGGRYDNLVEDLGGPSIPALGAAIGMERLALALKEAGLGPKEEESHPDVYVLVPDEAGLADAARLCDRWRRDGLRVRWDCAPRSIRAGLKADSERNRT